MEWLVLGLSHILSMLYSLPWPQSQSPRQWAAAIVQLPRRGGLLPQGEYVSPLFSRAVDLLATTAGSWLQPAHGFGSHLVLVLGEV